MPTCSQPAGTDSKLILNLFCRRPAQCAQGYASRLHAAAPKTSDDCLLGVHACGKLILGDTRGRAPRSSLRIAKTRVRTRRRPYDTSAPSSTCRGAYRRTPVSSSRAVSGPVWFHGAASLCLLDVHTQETTRCGGHLIMPASSGSDWRSRSHHFPHRATKTTLLFAPIAAMSLIGCREM
jgi:hypothetical protein